MIIHYFYFPTKIAKVVKTTVNYRRSFFLFFAYEKREKTSLHTTAEMSYTAAHCARSFSTSGARDGKRNFKNFVLYGRGTEQFRKQQEENPDKSLRIADYGIREITVKVGRKLVTIKEKIPDIIVPNLDDFHLKPYVSYRVPEITQSAFTAQDLFNAVYRKKIVEDFKNNKLKENGDPVEPSKEELLTPEQAKIKSRQTGSDLFSQGR